MKNDQGVCTVKDGIEIRKKCVHLIHRSDHNDDDDDSYDNDDDDEYYYNNNNNNNSFVRSCIHSFKDLSTEL
jgi:hypothetical protein